ncbi:MAG: T9SS type A sorting domain-containing protein [Bacteroidales bacterium]|nr:T9SS type A sorting domain-containing protein [Bacteroidales bacterium]
MLKTANNNLITPAGARALVLLAIILCCGATGLRGQSYFTLTNGNYYWFEGREIDSDDGKFLTGYDQANSWAKIYTRGTHSSASTTEIVAQGDTYLALDTTDAAHPTFQSFSTAGGFNPLCVWLRTGNTGNYYQEWNGYRYYIIASHSEGLSIYKVAADAPLQKKTTWYNWDHGCAITEQVSVPGGTKEYYFWMIYDTLNDADGTRAANPQWRMSEVSSYQRPNELIYSNYRADGSGGNTWDNASNPDKGISYFDNVRVGGTLNYPAGAATTYMEVKKTEHDRVISGVTDGQGLVDLSAAAATIGYGEAVSLQANVVTATSDYVTATVTEAYTEYNEETYRRGINLDYSLRTSDNFGSAGVPTYSNWYYYGGNRYTTPPTAQSVNLTIDSVRFSIDNRAQRYLSVANPVEGATQNLGPIHYHPWTTSLTCRDIPMVPTTATITATVYYNNGTTQQMSTTVTVSAADLSHEVASTKAPVIKGYVVGGGRMANVTGNTSVTVHNADSIYAIYGGNDIAGWVQGEEGATIQVGSRYTNADHPIHIDYLYGGGCGYYRYSGTYDAATSSWADNATKTTSVEYGQYAFRGGVYDWNDPTREVVAPGTFDYDPYTGADFATVEDGNRTVGTKLAGTIPYVKTSHVNIGVPEVEGHSDALGHNAHEHNDHIYIDSLFGGAENAFIGISSTSGDYASAITLDINGGTVLAAFGGNNYGGAVAQTSMTFVNVGCTKLVDDRALTHNTYFNGYGRDFGIRHLFGGGNRVDCSYVQVQFNGGMVDTAFVGGNNATVKNPICFVDCQRDGTVYDVNGESGGSFMNGHFIYTNNSITSPTDTANNGLLWNNFDPDNGIYNVHYLYGGNNLAPMDNVSFVNLRSGGIGAVYGGGSQGDMTNNKTLAQAAAEHMSYFDIRPLLDTMSDILSYSSLVTVPNKIGSVIYALSSSKVIADYVYGGCRRANVTNSCGIYAAGGCYGDIIAGNDVSGDVGSEHDGATYLVVTKKAVVQGNVYGGGDGYYHCDDGTGHYSDQQIPNPFSSTAGNDPYNDFAGLLMPTVQHTNVFINGGLVKGDVVGGGLLADVGFRSSAYARIKPSGEAERTLSTREKNGTVRLEIGGTAEIRGNVFGGGANASIWGLSQIYVKETPTILGSLFAGNDCVGSVQSFLPYQSVVNYAGCTNATDSLRAESENQANQFSSNGDSLNYYTTTEGGIKQYNPRYSTYVLIEGSPVINSVYGSGNGKYDYDGTHPEFPAVAVCPGTEGDRPDQASTFIDLHTEGGFIDTVFGGGAGCSVSDKVAILLNNTGVTNSFNMATLPSNFAGGKTGNYVGTIFGGNNFDDMNVVPNIHLVKGNVKNVYGGGNRGDMTKKDVLYDICGNEVPDVSTYVFSESDYVTVTDTVFGGCRMSNTEGMSYVDVRRTSAEGIQYLYGGNDISGSIKGNTRVDVSGGLIQRIWGGSNGRYDYVPVGHERYNVYKYGTYDQAHPETGLIATAAKPDVDSSNVNLWGGTVNASVYAGGSMAECRTTCLVVDDLKGCTSNGVSTGNVTVNGSLFGGGEGRWDDLNLRDFDGKRWGNVTGSTYVHLYHAKNVTTAKAYGGGSGGDVTNTYIKTYPTWNNPFLAIYGGCWGSDVHGTAYLEFDGDTLVNNLFGGNDFSGNVYRTEMVVNNGNFYNVYGGGNGDYPDSYYHTQHGLALSSQYAYMNASSTVYAGGDSIERPNTEYIHITFNDGEVDSCLYGGGKFGTVLPLKKNSSGEYEYDQTRLTNDGVYRYMPDTTRTKATTVSDPEDLAYIVLNVHDGKFHRNVFGGGRGNKKTKKPIVYGLKVVNMDGGEIYESLYGGSEFVNDGYIAECKPATGANPTRADRLAVSTMRPSSIVNITGGIVGSNFYGAGYQGIVYGSAYVNIGMDAIDSSTVWRNTYGNDTQDSTYKKFKPGYKGGYSDALVANTLALENSIYSGANWGNASGAVSFDNPGFMGGESRMYIDGKGYNTTNDMVSADPEMIIMRSLFGSGTSVLGGDIHSHIEVRNYGGMEACAPTKSLETMQRTDSLWLHNTAILLTGTTDASQQYMSNRYAIKNVKQMNYRGYNVTKLQAAIDNVEGLGFYEQGTSSSIHSGEQFDTVQVVLSELNGLVDASACGDNVDICDKEYVVSPSVATKRHTLMILDNGVSMSIGKSDNSSTDYGAVTGYGYVTTPGGYQSSITARPKMELSANFNMNDGGFVTTCRTDNKTRTVATNYTQINTDWLADGADELPYTNHATTDANGYTGTTKYREWKVGDEHGLREVEATLLAHSSPDRLNRDWSMEIGAGSVTHKYGVAEVAFEMPATEAGHYYKLIGEGFVMTGSNGEIDLVDSAWHPTLNSTLTTDGNVDMTNALSNIKNWYDDGNQDPDTKGEWINIPNGNPSEMEGPTEIRQRPDYTFGLVMVPNGNFAAASATTFDMPALIDHDDDPATPEVAPDQDWAYFVINGNARVNSVNHYCSPKVYNSNDPANPQLKPSMRLYLTYDTTFTNTFNGNVVFKMMEYDENDREVAPIQVKVNIQTIIDELKDMDQDVLAMYNGGRTNTFTRKLELVPCGEERNLYIKSIRWMPTDNNGGDTITSVLSSAFGNGDRFSLLPNPSDVTATSDNYPHAVSVGHPGDNNHNSHNRFAMSIIPSNNVSEDAGMANGWIRGTGVRTNLYKLAYPSGTDPVKTCTWNGSAVAPYSLQSVNGNDAHGYFLGTLDGRGSAMIDVELAFDGTRVYDAMDGKGYVGKVILTMETFTEEDDISRGTFDVTLYVKTRSHGDTIYMASANSVTRQIAPNKSVTVYPYSDVVHNGTSFQKNEIGKTPGLYVQSFRKALEEGIYQEGDVLCIMDELVIDNTPVHITGPNGPAIEVIRYDGHHHQLPDEQSVYRGPMIVVRNGGTFTAENIAFHGGAGSHVTHVVREGAATYDAANLNANANLDGSGNLQFYSYTAGGKTLDKLPDTNRVYAPIILATGTGSSVNLREGALVQHNWNEYGSLSGQTDGNGMPTDASLMGAISVTDGARLTLGGNVTVENNFSHTMTGLDDLTHDSISIQKAPGGGAIYVDGGTVELPESNRNTAIDITRNYLMNPIIDSDPSAVTWWDEVVIDGVPERYIIDTADLRTWPRANVLLTREAASGTHYEQVMNDTQSDMIVVSGTVGDETKIGVRKWFPGIHERDTIRFATVVGGNNTVLANAVRENENFVSDDHFSIFYNPSVNLINAYLFRCATFRHQLASDMYIGPLYERDNTLTLASGDVLHFGVKNNVCPTGGDSIIYRVQGGMMPYTYTWTDLGKSTTIQTTTTPYSNAQVQYDLAGGENGTAVTGDDRYAKYAASIADTLLLPNEAITTATSSVWNHLLVSVTDATGECALYKNIDLRILMDHEAANPATYWPKATAAADTASHRDNSSPWMSDTVGSGWTDTARSVLAIASRNFSGVQITPRVWVDRSNGTISATVAGADNDYVYQYVGESESHELADLNFCPGDTIYLYTEPRGSTNKFIMWDFDPYYRPLALYTVPAHDATVTAYYGPDEYWSEHVNSVATAHAAYDDNYYYAGNNGNSYVTTLHGDVHIYDENGLAWFISVVNGLNGAQARQFYFNKVFLHQKSGGYDMKNYLWTPVGTNHQPFRGWFLGVGSNATDTVRLRDEQVVIKNIIVNEPNMNYTGFFGNIDTARICGIKLESALIRGSQYVGTVAACSKDAQLDNVVVADSAELSSATTILATNYTSGGMIGKSTHDVVTNVSVKAKFIGDAVYSGGMVGYGVSTTVTNSYGYNDNRMNGLYIGGVAGYLDGTAGSKGGLFRKSKSASPSVVANNFVRLENSEGTRVGGIAGYAKNSEIENNYFYGDINNAGGSGVASSLNHSNADGNYYEQGAAKQSVGSSINGSYVDNISTFEGAGNGVTLAQSVHGRNNLTRVLNAWVREQNAAGGDYHTWRSDLESTNGGYPIFGTPDLIPLRDSMTVYGCDSVEWNGNYYADGETMSYRVIDTVEMVDSMMTIHFAAHFSSHEQYADSALVGEAYSGYGFTLTAAETALLQSTVENYGFATLVLSDTLATEYGCDSIITLTLTFYANVSIPQVTKSHVLVYPNPTTARVTVEAESMKHVELYDNDGRRLADYDTYGNDEITIDIKHYSTGIYYLRVHAADGVTIQKLIKK